MAFSVMLGLDLGLDLRPLNAGLALTLKVVTLWLGLGVTLIDKYE